MVTTIRASSAAFLLLLGACTSPRFYDDRYLPAPLEAEVGSEAVAGSQVRALVTVIGIERAAEGHGVRAVVRIRLENLGGVPAKLERESLSLVSADLVVFGPAEVVSVDPAEMAEAALALGQAATFDLVFPLPAGRTTSQIDLSGLNLRFALRFGDRAMTTGATFRRMEWGYWDPGYPQVSWGVGMCWSN